MSGDLVSDLASLRTAWSSGARPKFVYFWGLPSAHLDKVKSFGVGPWVLSQWYPARFEMSGIPYATAEHWMMSAKCRLFQDHNTLKLVTEDSLKPRPDPQQAKRLGRNVVGFNDAEWDRYKFNVVVNGNTLKFGQNPALRDYLISTGDAVLVEASPYDRVWGIGLAKDRPEAQDPTQWNGENLLGFALMRVRSKLQAG